MLAAQTGNLRGRIFSSWASTRPRVSRSPWRWRQRTLGERTQDERIQVLPHVGKLFRWLRSRRYFDFPRTRRCKRRMQPSPQASNPPAIEASATPVSAISASATPESSIENPPATESSASAELSLSETRGTDPATTNPDAAQPMKRFVQQFHRSHPRRSPRNGNGSGTVC